MVYEGMEKVSSFSLDECPVPLCLCSIVREYMWSTLLSSSSWQRLKTSLQERGRKLTHLKYADNTLLFILVEVALIGFLANPKTSLVLLNISKEEYSHYASGWKIGALPLTYQATPLKPPEEPPYLKESCSTGGADLCPGNQVMLQSVFHPPGFLKAFRKFLPL